MQHEFSIERLFIMCFVNKAHLGLIHCHQQFSDGALPIVKIFVSFQKGSEKSHWVHSLVMFLLEPDGMDTTQIADEVPALQKNWKFL